MEILLLHPGGLGDIILSLPAIDLLRMKYPAARFTIAANLDHAPPVLGSRVERAVSLSSLPLHNLYSDNALSWQDVGFWKSYDQIISWTGSGDAGFVRRMKEIHPHALIASWRPGPRETRHVAQIFIDSLGPEIAAGVRAVPSRIRLDFKQAGQGLQWLSAHNWKHRFALLHPGAGSAGKRWPLDRFIRLAGQLALREKRKFLIIEGPAESGIAARMAGELPQDAVMPSASLPLDTLAAVMAGAEFFVGNDSGIAHLAAALGIPSIVIFGPTLPQHWAPLGPQVTVLRDFHGCDACMSGGNDHSCMGNISVEDVIKRIPDSRHQVA